jgi:hypothetical protein
VRIWIISVVLAMLSGCSLVECWFDFTDYPIKPEDAVLSREDKQGLLVYGLTVNASVEPGQDLIGTIQWIAEDGHGVRLYNIPFPKQLQPGEHTLIVWPADCGVWSLRNAEIGEGRAAKLSDVLLQETAATLVKAGHVTLAGEITVQKNGNSLVMSYSPDTTFARTVLKSIGNITAPLLDKPLVDQRMRPISNKHPSKH